ncbi:hypothetical protein KC325_g15 [Hortaea werneckii]|nr:hypothetical protein KC325_g15 [Hortaea werneckii]
MYKRTLGVLFNCAVILSRLVVLVPARLESLRILAILLRLWTRRCSVRRRDWPFVCIPILLGVCAIAICLGESTRRGSARLRGWSAGIHGLTIHRCLLLPGTATASAHLADCAPPARIVRMIIQRMFLLGGALFGTTVSGFFGVFFTGRTRGSRLSGILLAAAVEEVHRKAKGTTAHRSIVRSQKLKSGKDPWLCLPAGCRRLLIGA